MGNDVPFEGAIVTSSRRLDAVVVPMNWDCLGLVQGDPTLYPIAKCRVANAGIVPKRFHDCAPSRVQPSANVVFQRLREVPVILRDPGLDPMTQQVVYETIVEVDPRLVDR